MKAKILLTALFIASGILGFSQQFLLKGVFTNNNQRANTMVYLLKVTNVDELFSGSNFGVVDSSSVDAAGNFKFTNGALIEDNNLYRINVVEAEQMNAGGLTMIGTHENFAFFLLNKHSQLSFSTNSEQVGQQLLFSKTDKANALIHQLAVIRKQYNELVDGFVHRRNAVDRHSSAYADSASIINGAMQAAATTVHYFDNIKTFADTVSNPYISLLATEFLPDDVYHSFYIAMNERYRKLIPASKYTEQFNAALKGETNVLKTGSKAPRIRLQDNKGKTIDLADLKGKYVLVDFWASWCAPCRNEQMNYVKPMYNEYGSKDFAVLSVSMDINKANWLGAIKQDDVDLWHHVCDLKGAASPTITEYHVTVLPSNYIVDPNGIIVAQNLHGAELYKFVKDHCGH